MTRRSLSKRRLHLWRFWRVAIRPPQRWKVKWSFKDRLRFGWSGVGKLDIHSDWLHEVAFPDGCGVEGCEWHR